MLPLSSLRFTTFFLKIHLISINMCISTDGDVVYLPAFHGARMKCSDHKKQT